MLAGACIALLLAAFTAAAGNARSRVQVKTPAQFLALAETDLARTQHAFWNPELHWYDERLSRTPIPTSRSPRSGRVSRSSRRSTRSRPRPDAGQPIAEVRAFVRGAERYYNPDLRPVGGYD